MAFKIAEAFVDLKVDQAGLRRNLAQSQTLLQGFTRRASGLGTAIGTGLARGLGSLRAIAGVGGVGLFATQGVRAFSSFEEAMGKVFVLLDDAGKKRLPELSAAVKKTANEFGFASEDTAAALFDIVSGYSNNVDKAMEMLRAMAILSRGGFAPMAITTSAVITAMATYGTQLRDVQDALDVLFVTQAKGRLNMALLAGQFGVIAAGAKDAGLAIEDLSALLATATRVLEITRVATGGAMLMKLFGGATPAQIKAARRIGIELTPEALAREGLIKVVERFARVSVEQRRAVVQEQRAYNVLSALINNLTALRENRAAAVAREGSAMKATEEALDLNAVKLSRLRESWVDLTRSVGEFLTDIKIPEVLSELTAAIRASGAGFTEEGRRAIDVYKELHSKPLIERFRDFDPTALFPAWEQVRRSPRSPEPAAWWQMTDKIRPGEDDVNKAARLADIPD